MLVGSSSSAGLLARVVDLVKSEKFDDAFKVVSEFNTIETVIAKAYIYLMVEKFNEANEFARKCRSIDDDAPSSKIINGYAQLTLGQFQNAFLEFSDASGVSNGDRYIDLTISLGKAVSNGFRRMWTESIEELEAAVKSAGENPCVLATAASIYANMPNKGAEFDATVAKLQAADPNSFISQKLVECDAAFAELGF